MNSRQISASILLAAALGACTPLNQAALVYSSKAQVGVNVAAGTPENPGVELSIGVNVVDAAYVPTAVARNCENATPKDCETTSYDVIPIYGRNDRSNQDRASEVALDDANRELEVKRKQVADLQAKIDEATSLAKSAAERITALDAAIEVETKRAAAPTDPPTAPAVDLATLRTQKKTLEDDRDKASGKLPALNSSLQAALSERDRVLARVQQLQAARDRSRQDQKADALSVFGSFDTNTSASGSVKPGGETGAGAGVALGKVFSTGVAAQNLTQGIGDSARVSAMARCLAEAKTLADTVTDPGKKQQMITDLRQLCERVAESD
jgi:peptidoglycan hydrolase CwlO-like protein